MRRSVVTRTLPSFEQIDMIESVKPRVAPEAYNCLVFIGLWKPNFKSNFGKLLYDSWTLLTIVITELMYLSMFLGAIWNSNSIDEFINGSYLLLPIFNATVKCFNMLLQKRRLRKLIRMYVRVDYLPKNKHERELYDLFTKISRYLTISGILVSEGAATVLMTVPVIFSNETHVYPLGGWRPFETSSDLIYWCFYLHQGFGLYTIAMWNAAVDVFIAGMMLQTCFHLEVMAYRLQRLPYLVGQAVQKNCTLSEVRRLERRTIESSVYHHLHILDIADNLQTSFGPSILAQYCLSSFMLCTAIYQMMNIKSDGGQFLMVIFFALAMFYEFFIYCYFGNELTYQSLQFTETVCKGDWTTLSVDSLKSLMFMMMRSSKPITISCGPLIILSNDTFVGIVKLSYSVFNLLKQSM